MVGSRLESRATLQAARPFLGTLGYSFLTSGHELTVGEAKSGQGVIRKRLHRCKLAKLNNLRKSAAWGQQLSEGSSIAGDLSENDEGEGRIGECPAEVIQRGDVTTSSGTDLLRSEDCVIGSVSDICNRGRTAMRRDTDGKGSCSNVGCMHRAVLMPEQVAPDGGKCECVDRLSARVSTGGNRGAEEECKANAGQLGYGYSEDEGEGKVHRTCS